MTGAQGGAMGRPMTGSMGGAPYSTTSTSSSPYGGSMSTGAPYSATGVSPSSPMMGSPTSGSPQFRGVPSSSINTPAYNTSTVPGRVAAPVDNTPVYQPTSGSGLSGSGVAPIHQVPSSLPPAVDGTQSKIPGAMSPGISGIPTNPVSGPTITDQDPE